MQNKIFYVYEWYNVDTNEVFYVGKGCGKRYQDKTHRNKLFLDYIEHNSVNSRIIAYFEDEDKAYEYEEYLTNHYREQGFCSCNLIDGGYGGYSKIWTPEMKEYWSKYNPMKEEKQKERMRQNNPMKNKEIALKNGKKHKRQVIINDMLYDGVKDAAEALQVSTDSIIQWCKQGGNVKGDKCRYADEEQKTFIYKKPGSKSVYVDDQVFESLAEAARVFNFSYDSFRRALKEKNEYKGHKCGYANQQPS